ncbi:hypothetical protein [Luteolibacter sp. AS25]|uniref:hypothetical protein n=1 Tax=Luteolibacter sp. AS25 TaxID=3135776 RepID=UPI00398B805E
MRRFTKIALISITAVLVTLFVAYLLFMRGLREGATSERRSKEIEVTHEYAQAMRSAGYPISVIRAYKASSYDGLHGDGSSVGIFAPCYMLWDMDCGIDSFRYSGIPSHIEQSIQLLSQLAKSDHPATIESAVHGVGHLIGEFRDRCLPPLESVISRTDIPEELREYASQAIHHYIQ